MGQVDDKKKETDAIQDKSRMSDKKLEQVSGGRYQYPTGSDDNSDFNRMFIHREGREQKENN